MGKVIFQLEQFHCPSCINKIETGLQNAEGVRQAFVFFNSCKAKIEYDPNQTDPEQLKSMINGLGYVIQSRKKSE